MTLDHVRVGGGVSVRVGRGVRVGVGRSGVPDHGGRRGGGEAAVRSTGTLRLSQYPGGVAMAGGTVARRVHFSLVMMGTHRLRVKRRDHLQCSEIMVELRR